MNFGLYLHIPYCLAKCRYCDFYSAGGGDSVPQEYLDALLAQLAQFASQNGNRQPSTVYFGGGTPSLLTPQQAGQLIAAANPQKDAEITLEANPETVTASRLEGFLAAGVNRLSLGVQSAYDEQLVRLGRPHTAQQAKKAFAAAKKAGFRNISGDIMLGLPQYSNAEFDETLALIAEGGATHVSAYLLKIEPDTYFGKHRPAGLPDEDACADFYLYAVEQLAKAGYPQYEISNFAKVGFEGKHNLLYWNCHDYLGLGPAAHSCLGGKRFYWPSNTAAFVAGEAQMVPDGDCTAEDYIMLQLRLRSGLDLTQLKNIYKTEFSQKQLQFAEKCVNAGYAVLEGNRLRLTPIGLIVQNSILVELLS